MEENLMPNADIPENTGHEENTGWDDAYVEQILAQKNMKKCFNRIGWAVFTTLATWIALLTGITVVALVLDELKVFSQFSAVNFYNQYLFVFNEVTLLVGILAGALVLSRVPKAKIEGYMPSFGFFWRVLCICFAVAYAANLLSNFFLTFWNVFSGIEVTDDVMAAVSGVDPIQMILCVGIVAPILEELFFRKFLIDRIRPYGELPAILVTALLFALFHQNVIQFLYTFGVGVLLGYVYYRTGNYIVTTILHVAFNLISGVIPTLLLPGINAFLEEIMRLAEVYINDDEAFLKGVLEALQQCGPAILLYWVYSMILLALNIMGIVFFFVRMRKFRADKGKFTLRASEQMNAVFANPGMIVCISFLGLLTLSSLFL